MNEPISHYVNKVSRIRRINTSITLIALNGTWRLSKINNFFILQCYNIITEICMDPSDNIYKIGCIHDEIIRFVIEKGHVV